MTAKKKHGSGNRVVVLAGGTGGAKLARGMLDVVGPENLTVIANTGDDIDIYGLHVSPDPDLITYWLADRIDEARGWGIEGELFATYSQLAHLGEEECWFQLGDLDLANCMYRTWMLQRGARLTDAAARIATAMGVAVEVLPMSDDRVTTYVRAGGRWRHFQEYLVLLSGSAPIEDYEFRGVQNAYATLDVITALSAAEAIVIGPSNPIASIGPILAVGGIREAMQLAPAPIVAISPLVDGRSLKGPTERFMAAAGLDISEDGVIKAYQGLLDGLICDRAVELGEAVEIESTNTLMDTAASRKKLAEEAILFSERLNGR